MQDVVDSIRKLLRLAAESPSEPERRVAADRAEALMRKHRVHVTAEDGHHRTPVGGVVGSPWKSQVLASLARLHRCKLVRRNGGGTDLVVVGARADVEVVINDYRRLYVEIVGRYLAAWSAAERFERSRENAESVEDAMNLMFGQDDLSEVSPDKVFEVIAERALKAGERRRKLVEERQREMAAAEELWRAEFFSNLAESVTSRLKPVTKAPRPQPVYERLPFMPQTPSEREREKQRLDEVVKSMTDTSFASRLMRTAAERGRLAALGLPWCWSAARQLAAASESFPPPPPPPPPPVPTRYNQIDMD